MTGNSARGGDHDVLEVAGRRSSAYRSVDFDTGDLRCFREHRDGVLPRFKARTRHNVDSDDVRGLFA